MREKVEIFLRDEDIWFMCDKMAILFGVQRPAITKHLKNIFESGELVEKVVNSILEHTMSSSGCEMFKFLTNRPSGVFLFYLLDKINFFIIFFPFWSVPAKR